MRNFIECNTIAILSIPVLLGFGPPAFAQTAAPAPEPAGKVEFAQTHVLQRTGGTLNAPVQIPDRQTLLLFTPTSAIPEDYAAYLDITLNGESVQSIPLAEPDGLPGNLEDKLSDVQLPRYSTTAWSALISSDYMSPEYKFSIRYDGPIDLNPLDVSPLHWSRPADFTIARIPMVLWSPANTASPVNLLPAAKLAQDYFASAPLRQLKLVDYTPMKFDYLITHANAKPVKKYNTDQDLQADGMSDLYGPARELTMRVSLANTGRGLLDVFGDSSPYSFGTYVGLGWRYQPSTKKFYDTNTGGASGGWTGWTEMWNTLAYQCSNAFIHEVGHSFTLYHFVEGTAKAWKIDSEYPHDGVNGPANPSGFDSTRNLFRTWYEVNENGPVHDHSGALAGKHDPMNGGESANKITCFPQYTAYQAMKMQGWLNTTPTLLSLNGVPGVYKWNNTTRTYSKTAPAAGALEPTGIDLPVTTVMGTLTSSDTNGTSQIYPAIFAKSGNLFDLPDPFSKGLPHLYNDARYFVKVTNSDDSARYILIPQPNILNDKQLRYFSFNLDFRSNPVRLELYHADTGYPDISLETSHVTNSIDIKQPDLEELSQPVSFPKASQPNEIQILKD
ncbi:M66 family metalloprotease [Phyllobacterium sophorae]|uniref:M66 family metalloprotease n=1 Tax=Phyllobacterium sophorae TaxID=1520277 RepID=UPI001AECE603|nr:M66 family metalloprotease [Phyllobacterium sophorae]